MSMLMAYGPFRFAIATFAYEQFKRRHTARIEPQNVIGGRPVLHKMGFEAETVSFTATFFPKHLPGNMGLAQLAGMRAAVGLRFPLLGTGFGIGDMFGFWVLKSIEDSHSEIYSNGVGQKIETQIELIFDGPSRTALASAVVARIFG